MREIDNIGLIILTRLLADNEPLKLVIPSNDYIQTSINNLTRFLKWSFRELEENTISITESCGIIKLILNNRAELERFISEYAQKYETGNIIENGNITPIAYNSLLRQFKNSIDTSRNLTRYVITNVEYTPILLKLYADDNRTLAGVQINLVSCENVLYPIVSYENEHWLDFFDCKLVVNINSLFKNKKKVNEAPKEPQTEGLKGYSKQIQQLDKLLSNLVKAKEYSFFKSDIVDKKITRNLKSCDTLLTRYNDLYKQCYRNFTPFHFDKTEQKYIIDNIDESTNLYISIDSYVSKS